MGFFEAILQGIIQGLTEFLPISSSGHLALYQHFTGQNADVGLMFTVLLHLGTLAAVLIVFYKTLWLLIKELVFTIKDIFTGKFKWKEMNSERRMLFMMVISTLMLLPLAIPFLKGDGGERMSLLDWADPLTKGTNLYIIGVCFLVTGILLLVSSYVLTTNMRRKDNANVKDAILIGITQAVAAVFPGISRSGSTVSTGLLCGLKKQYAINYSFILSIPAIVAANIFEVGDALAEGADISVGPTIAGVLVAALVGIFAIKAITWLVMKNRYSFFGFYCLAIGVLVILVSVLESQVGNIFQVG